VKTESVKTFTGALKRAARRAVFCAIFLLGPFYGGDLFAHGHGGGGGHGGVAGGHGGGGGHFGGHSGGQHGFGGHGFAHADIGHHDFQNGGFDHHHDFDDHHHHADFHHDRFFFHHHHPILFGFPPSSYGYPSYYDPCDPYSPYYDPDYCCWLRYGYYPDDPAPLNGYGQSYRAPRVKADPARRKTSSITHQQADSGRRKQKAVDTCATDPSSNSKQAEFARVSGDQDIRAPLVSSLKAPEALPNRGVATR
jgi:hypothetical protein